MKEKVMKVKRREQKWKWKKGAKVNRNGGKKKLMMEGEGKIEWNGVMTLLFIYFIPRVSVCYMLPASLYVFHHVLCFPKENSKRHGGKGNEGWERNNGNSWEKYLSDGPSSFSYFPLHLLCVSIFIPHLLNFPFFFSVFNFDFCSSLSASFVVFSFSFPHFLTPLFFFCFSFSLLQFSFRFICSVFFHFHLLISLPSPPFFCFHFHFFSSLPLSIPS